MDRAESGRPTRAATAKTIVWGQLDVYLDYDEESRTYPQPGGVREGERLHRRVPRGHRRQRVLQRQVAPQLANGQNIGYDIVTLTDWMAAEWIPRAT